MALVPTRFPLQPSFPLQIIAPSVFGCKFKDHVRGFALLPRFVALAEAPGNVEGNRSVRRNRPLILL